jgi:hypothetical protein
MTPEETTAHKKALCKPFKGVTYSPTQDRYQVNKTLKIGRQGKPHSNYLGSYEDVHHAAEARRIADQVKIDKGNGCRRYHFDEAIDIFRASVGIPPIARNFK